MTVNSTFLMGYICHRTIDVSVLVACLDAYIAL